MIRSLLFSAAAALTLLFNGCANDLAPEQNDRPPAPYSPDATAHVPQPHDPNPLGGSPRY